MTTAIQKNEDPKSLKGWLSTDYFKEQIRIALPAHMKPDRFVRVALTALLKTPKLAECSRESVIECFLNLSQMGLEADGRRAHLIPYGDKCTLIIDYKGIVELVRRSGEVTYIHADVVHENDSFEYIFGTGAFLKHKPAITNRGKPICAYSFIKLKDGSEDFDVMDVESIEKTRSRSRAARSGPWVTDWSEMAKKTIFRRHSKWLPLSPELRDKIEMDDEPLTEQEQFASATVMSSSKSNLLSSPPIEQPISPAAVEEPRPVRRGRPPKSEIPTAPVAAPVVMPAPEPEPEPPAPAPDEGPDLFAPAAPKPEPVSDPTAVVPVAWSEDGVISVQNLRQALRGIGIPEIKLVDWMKAQMMMNSRQTEIAHAANSKLKIICEKFPEIVQEIQQGV